MKYLVEFTQKDGKTIRLPLSMKGLHDAERKGKNVRTVGEICDFKALGDMCGSWCYHYAHGQCRAKIFKDCNGCKWHVWSNV